MNCDLPTIATNQGGPAEIIADGVSGFHIDPNNGVESSNKITDFFQKCKEEPDYLNRISIQGLQPPGDRSIELRSMLKGDILKTFYNLQFKNLVKNLPIKKEEAEPKQKAKPQASLRQECI
ncbi:hypothetical protein ACS0TY_025322 [Phlomoides rotata]